MSAAGRCGSEQRSRYFPSRFASVLILALSMRSSPPGVTCRYRFSPGLVEIFPRSSPRFITGRLSDPAINSVSWATSCSRMCASRVAASGLWQITTPLGVRHPDFLDPHVPRDLGVAALPGEGGFDLRGRPAVLVFLNGLPVALFELKNPADEKATIERAYAQVQTYRREIPSLFVYNELVVLSDGLLARL